MIESAQIKNFQSHRNTELTFDPGVNVIIGSSDSGKTVTFTIPEGSGIGKVALCAVASVHDTSDYNAVLAGMQLEEGSTKTAYETPGTPPDKYIKDDRIPVTIARTTDVIPVLLADSFDMVPCKNLCDPSLAADGKLYLFDSGTSTPYANGMTFGKQVVTEGESYTWSMPSSGPGFYKYGTGEVVLYCYDSAGAFLGLSYAVDVYPAAETVPTNVVSWDSGKTFTFTIPAESGIGKIAVMAAYSAHDTAAFNAVMAGLQLELGTEKTEFIAYGSGDTYVIKDEYVPDTIARTDSSSDAATSKQEVLVCMDDTNVYVRTHWNATLDLVQCINYGATTAFANNPVNPMGARTIPIATTDSGTIAAYASGTVLVSQGDDATPLFYNGTYIGANHGPNFVHAVTVADHDKTVADVGSTWTSGGVTYTLMRIVSASALWLMSANTGANTEQWNFSTTTLAAGTLVHAAGATHTGSFSPSADTITQLLPVLQNHTKTIRLDGRLAVTASGSYWCEFVDIVDTYDICNPVSILSYVQSQVGGATQPSFTDPSVTSDMRVNITYRFGSNGACSANTQFQAKHDLTFSFAGTIQANPLTFAGKSLYQYINKLTSIVGTSKTWDFTAVEDISTTIDAVYAITSEWADANNPPDRMAQIVKTGSTPEYGHVIGYGLSRGASIPATRKGVSDAGFIYTTRKMYPKALTGSQYGSGIIPENTVVSVMAYRSLYHFEDVPDATVFTWFWDGADIMVVLDIHSTVTALAIPLPSWMIGKNATLVDSSGTISLLTSIVNDDGLIISTTDYGSAMIKLS